MAVLKARQTDYQTASPSAAGKDIRALLQLDRGAADRNLQIMSQVIAIGDHAQFENAVFLARKRIVEASLSHFDLMVSSSQLVDRP
ncbi:hypothetical protein BBK36DRAFT_1161184 [Trichoderma citrinoviride]|uniref:Uncharacterized protein n=1 Tax=Trichoderma citrinoviride TaxID=58853 RepID=A0A2T4B478_9HYPO|nr:hypothetical protein BBK36DRAFT_1161184 [Trichoderma citrinoviride]PTB64124.1 hypothetical protein BBK36DRAFT_1161184 [Trichoderma citrinoviride]